MKLRCYLAALVFLMIVIVTARRLEDVICGILVAGLRPGLG